MKTNNRLVLPLIVILLIISLPFTAIGLGNKIISLIKGDNPEHLHKIENTLYYYDGNNKLIGRYECKNENCDTAKQTIDDPSYFSYLKNESIFDVFNNDYVFIQDGENVVLYNLRDKRQIGIYKSFKNYGGNINNNYVILQNSEGNYGLFDADNIAFKTSVIYAYIGISEKMINEPVEDLKLLVKDAGGNYSIIDTTGEIISVNFNQEIHDYDNSYVYTYSDDLYHLYNYEGIELLEKVKISNYEVYKNTIIITNKDGDILIYPYNLATEPLKNVKNNGRGISYTIEGDVIYIQEGPNKSIDSYNLSSEVESTDDPEEEVIETE